MNVTNLPVLKKGIEGEKIKAKCSAVVLTERNSRSYDLTIEDREICSWMGLSDVCRERTIALVSRQVESTISVIKGKIVISGRICTQRGIIHSRSQIYRGAL